MTGVPKDPLVAKFQAGRTYDASSIKGGLVIARESSINRYAPIANASTTFFVVFTEIAVDIASSDHVLVEVDGLIDPSLQAEIVRTSGTLAPHSESLFGIVMQRLNRLSKSERVARRHQ